MKLRAFPACAAALVLGVVSLPGVLPHAYAAANGPARDRPSAESASEWPGRHGPRTYTPSGTPVSGAPDGARAVSLAPGDYVDRMADKEVKYYAVDVPLGYTVYVSGTTVSTVKGLEALDLKQIDERSTSCKTDTGLSQSVLKVVTASLNWGATATGRNNSCTKPGRQVFSATRRGTGPPVPLELRIFLEPAVSDTGPAESVIARYTEPGGSPVPVLGGGSFTDAGTLPGSGHFTDDIAFGEWAFYRVRLDWGQSLAVQARVGGGRGYAPTEVRLYNPVREELAQESGSVSDTEHIFAGRSDPFATRPVRYLNRSDRQQEVADMLPGWYYLAVAVQGEGEQRSLAIDVSVGGTREPGPTYAPDPSVSATTPRSTASPGRVATSGGPTPGSAAQPTGGNQDSAGASAAFGGPAVWLGLPLALLLGAGLATWVIRRRGPETPCD
ncbi:hypothetical protein [Embleya scabrispora]|uniref:hypothetical protein n=1 Tax=Embleya scabrispora TaxID=159449 RepID=UPI0003619FD5|nr:hypothetical protein [Embleya scabrispora]MYS87398.1 hypothetical protein [Streptomyces sp. SID5474]